jgi:hypothetical protein
MTYFFSVAYKAPFPLGCDTGGNSGTDLRKGRNAGAIQRAIRDTGPPGFPYRTYRSVPQGCDTGFRHLTSTNKAHLGLYRMYRKKRRGSYSSMTTTTRGTDGGQVA